MFDWLVEKQDKRVAKSPEGYLVKSIADDYKTPKGFISRAERQQREEAKLAKDRQEAETRRLEREQDAAQKKVRQAINAYRKSLTPEQLDELKAEALAAATAESRESYQATTHREFKRIMLDAIIDGHIGTLLQTEPAGA